MIEPVKLSEMPNYDRLEDGFYLFDDYVDYVSRDISFEILLPNRAIEYRQQCIAFIFDEGVRRNFRTIKLDDLMTLCADKAPDALEWMLYSLDILT